jgi:hypothetical protein
MTDEKAPAEKPDEDEKPVRRRRAKAEGEICDQCWPNGWREGSANANCVHGTWNR